MTAHDLVEVEPVDELHDDHPAPGEIDEPVDVDHGSVPDEPENTGFIALSLSDLLGVVQIASKHLEGNALRKAALSQKAGVVDGPKRTFSYR